MDRRRIAWKVEIEIASRSHCERAILLDGIFKLDSKLKWIRTHAILKSSGLVWAIHAKVFAFCSHTPVFHNLSRTTFHVSHVPQSLRFFAKQMHTRKRFANKHQLTIIFSSPQLCLPEHEAQAGISAIFATLQQVVKFVPSLSQSYVVRISQHGTWSHEQVVFSQQKCLENNLLKNVLQISSCPAAELPCCCISGGMNAKYT